MATRVDIWDQRADRNEFHAVLTERWSSTQCAEVDRLQRLALAAAMPPLLGRRVMDLGGGIGRITGWLARGAPTHSDAREAVQEPNVPAVVVGVDRSVGMLNRAAQDIRAPGIILVQAPAKCLPFPDHSFDVIVTVAVLQHLVAMAEFERACNEIVRVLRPGGVLVCIEGGSDPMPTFRNPGGGQTVTIPRGVADFATALGPRMRPGDACPLICIQDEYLLTTWTLTREEGTL